MKKVIFVFALLIVLSPLCAKVLIRSNIGPEFLIIDERVTVGGETYILNERITTLSFANDFIFLGDSSKVGFLLGTSVDFPLAMKIDGVDYVTEFKDSTIYLKAGFQSFKEIELGKYYVSGAYRFGINYESEYVSGESLSLTTKLHMLEAKTGLEFIVTDIAMDLGVSVSLPIFATSTLKYGTEKVNETSYPSGICIKPYVGMKINV